MLPDPGALVAGYALYAQQNHYAPEVDRDRLTEALQEAEAHAQGHPGDEPAALFFALTRRPRIFGKAHGRMTLHLTIEQARSASLAFSVDLAVLELMRARVLRAAIDFNELRAWFEAHLEPVSRKPWPPR